MSDEKTSPGPWRVDGRDVRAADGTTVCRADWNVNSDDGSDQRWVTDSALIASAPTLRDQLDRAVALLRRYVDAEFDEDPIAYEAHTFLDEIDKPG